MIRATNTDSSANVIVRGTLEPRLLTPVWLRQQRLVPEGEADQADIEIIYRDVVRFVIGSITVEATKDFLKIDAPNEQYIEPAKDLMLGVLRLLPNIAVTKLGLNHNQRYSLTNEQDWHQIGHRLAPKEMWHQVLMNPGMLRLDIQGDRPDGHHGYVRVRIEPIRSDDSPYGVVIDVNDHFDLDYDDSIDHGSEAARMIELTWREANRRAAAIFGKVMEQ